LAGAHVIEIAEPIRFLPARWVVLTTGMRLKDQEAEQRQLIRELSKGGVAALGFGVGPFFDVTPTALVEEAQELDFPIFSVPEDVPFRDIVRFVDGALLSLDLRTMRRSISMQEYLMESLGSEHPEAEIIERLSSLLDGSATLFQPNGRVIAASHPAQAERIWKSAKEADDIARPVRSDAGWVSVASVTRAGRRRWLLAVVTRNDPAATTLVRQVLTASARLLGGIALARKLEARQERARRAAVLNDALGGVDEHPVTAVGERADSFGFDFRSPALVAFITPSSPAREADSATAAKVTEALENAFDGGDVPYLLARRETGIAVLAQQDQEGLLATLAPVCAGCDLHAGVSRGITGIHETPAAFRDAQVAAMAGANEGRDRRVTCFEAVDVVAWMLRVVPSDGLGTKAAELLAPLRDRPELMESLCTFFDHNLKVNAAAAAMHLHPNSLRYRLARVEEVLGRRLDRPSDIAALHIARMVEAGRGETSAEQPPRP
jgi:purine catabolism regulator